MELSECNAAEIIEGVQAGQLHCGFLRQPVAQDDGLVFETLFREAMLVVLPSDHPLALRELRDEGFILVRRRVGGTGFDARCAPARRGLCAAAGKPAAGAPR